MNLIAYIESMEQKLLNNISFIKKEYLICDICRLLVIGDLKILKVITFTTVRYRAVQYWYAQIFDETGC